MFDFFRVTGAVPALTLGDPDENVRQMLAQMECAAREGSDLIVFPELGVCGYSLGDLFFQQALLDGVCRGIQRIVEATAALPIAAAIGAPLRIGGQLYNCALLITDGRIAGIVPKTFLPTYNEYYERRWFSSSSELGSIRCVTARELGIGDDATEIPLGRDLVFSIGGVGIGMELCEDLWSPLPPSTFLAMNGAMVVVNLSASNEGIAKRKYRQDMVKQQSAGCICAYVYVSAGVGESTTDVVFSGHCVAAENGRILCENNALIDSDYHLTTDIDIGKLRADRLKIKTFRDAAFLYGNLQPCRTIVLPDRCGAADGSFASVNKLPFVPGVQKDRLTRCMDIFQMQVAGLKKRLQITLCKPVIGISGGLDSTLALLVAVEAIRQLERPVTDVIGITMPCFGTSDRTYQNALTLMQTLGITSVEINIRAACEQHFRDIDHDQTKLDGTYENSQARERTQVLMDYASRIGGLVVGTGDLSELALGWCTYNGDHMSMYGVNVSVPKTLVRWMIDSLMDYDVFPGSTEVLRDVLDTPISPELLPPDGTGKIAQKTESIIGPYALHDFFLYYVLRYGFAPDKIYALAKRAFANDFENSEILKWLKSFYHRFFTQQFKRSCMPDGVKVGSVCLSPRGDWRMPSDASAALWLHQVDTLSE